MSSGNTHVAVLQETITEEIFKAFGWSPHGLWRQALNPVFRRPAHKFAQFAASFDARVAEFGLQSAVTWALERFVERVEADGAENIPLSGPLLIVSNHPGTYDGFSILKHVPRQDVKVVVSGIPFTHSLPATHQHLIFSTRDTHTRMNTLRSMLRHLKNDGALLIFPCGRLEPDPDILPGAEKTLADWSPSIEFVMRKVPQVQILVSIVSGVLAPTCLRNPLTRLRKPAWERQRIAEFIQIMRQVLSDKKYTLIPRVSFAQTFTPAELSASGESSYLMDNVIFRAQMLLSHHTVSPTR